MNIRPVNKRIIASLCKEPEKKVGSLLLPSQEPKKDLFEVISVAQNDQGIVKGDRILVDRYDAYEKEIDGEKFYVIAFERVLAVIG